jgi:proteasome assembly chaperone (PAC2) family protein
MVAGFNQWANAGNVSTAIPEYLIEKLNARRIGHIHKGDFYLFQLPETHYLLRPAVKYVEGYEEDYQEEPVNDFYYAQIGKKALVIFTGTEPNQHEDVYVNTLLDGATELGIRRIVVPAGVGGEVPFDKERLISCSYSLVRLHEELRNYAVTFSNYNKNATIGMVINHYSKERNIESITLSARTPNYQVSIAVPSDKRAVYDILRRIRYMFGIELDLSDLEKGIKEQISDFESLIKQLCLENPPVAPQITGYMEQIEKEFEEVRFIEPIKIPDVFLKGFDTPG